jgi:hypothetical protein
MGGSPRGDVAVDSTIASSNTVYVLAGKGAIVILPLLTVAVLVTLFVALQRDRRLRGKGGVSEPDDPGVGHRGKDG